MDVKEVMDGQVRRCDVCGRLFTPGNRAPGIPNGVSFVQRDGSLLTLCAECVMLIGMIKSAE